MKKVLMALTCALAIVAGAAQAEATTLSYGDSDYLGAIIPGIPPDPVNQAVWIADLIALDPGEQELCSIGSHPDTCTRLNSTVSGPFATPVDFDFKVEGGVSSIGEGFTTHDVGGFQYVLAFYGGGEPSGASYVWFIEGGITDGFVILPKRSQTAHGKKGLSHVSFFNRATVPDGGTSLALLGLALVGLGAARRSWS